MIILDVVKLNGSPIGLVAATSKSQVGYSLYNAVKERRDFDIGMATKIAVGRANKGVDPYIRLTLLIDYFHDHKGVTCYGLERVRLVWRAVNKMKQRVAKMKGIARTVRGF